jgi:hypothetical protein
VRVYGSKRRRALHVGAKRGKAGHHSWRRSSNANKQSGENGRGLQVLLGNRVNRGESVHRALQVLRECRLHSLRMPEELACHQTSEKGVAVSCEPLLEDLRVRNLQTSLPLSLQNSEAESLQTRRCIATNLLHSGTHLARIGRPWPLCGYGELASGEELLSNHPHPRVL